MTKVDTSAIVAEAAEYVRQGLGSLPIMVDGRNCRVRHLPGTEAGDKGKVLVEINLNENVGPSGSGQNIMIGTMGRNVSFQHGTLGVNFWRSAETAEEREALLGQAKIAAERAELEKKLRELKGA